MGPRQVQIKTSRKFDKKLKSVNRPERKRITEVIQKLYYWPTVNIDIKPMSNSINQHRIRVGKYRIICEIDNVASVIILMDVGTRGKIYKD